MDFRTFFLFFGAFIWSCGLTHASKALMLVWPAYRLDISITSLSALISVAGAILLLPLVPTVAAYPPAAKMEEMNLSLSVEVRRLRNDAALRWAYDEQGAVKKLAEVIAALREIESSSEKKAT